MDPFLSLPVGNYVFQVGDIMALISQSIMREGKGSGTTIFSW